MTPDIGPLMERSYADHVIYCIQPWCAQGGRLTRAQLFIGQDGKPKVPACCQCASNWQSRNSQPVEIWYIDEDLRERWWAAIDDAIAAQPPQPPAPPAPAAAPEPQPARKPVNGLAVAWLIAAAAAVFLLIGICMIVGGNDANNAANAANSAVSASTGDTSIVVGFLLSLVSGLVLLVSGLAGTVMTVTHVRQGPWGRYKTWKAGLSPEDQRKVWWAETGALWAAWGLVHRATHHGARSH
jgi:hypothetical protein